MSMELHDEASVDMDAICRKVSEMVVGRDSFCSWARPR